VSGVKTVLQQKIGVRHQMIDPVSSHDPVEMRVEIVKVGGPLPDGRGLARNADGMIVTRLCIPLGKPVKRPMVAAVDQTAVFADQRIHDFIIIVGGSDPGVDIFLFPMLEGGRQIEVIDDILFAAGEIAGR